MARPGQAQARHEDPAEPELEGLKADPSGQPVAPGLTSKLGDGAFIHLDDEP